ncbi:MAG: hypothetical protein QF570_17530 [Myxococcota bacterium]|jgi:hypothetical protein|nr:hypothetical protein [Myxococcota bacterium]
MFRSLVVSLSFILVSGSLADTAHARPEKIEPGVPYYSDDFVTDGLVHDIAQEKNYEEVYQFYTYYEVIYDEKQRVVVFTEYKRGDVLRRDEYAYDAAGNLATRTTKRPGQEPEVIRPGGDAQPRK